MKCVGTTGFLFLLFYIIVFIFYDLTYNQQSFKNIFTFISYLFLPLHVYTYNMYCIYVHIICIIYNMNYMCIYNTHYIILIICVYIICIIYMYTYKNMCCVSICVCVYTCHSSTCIDIRGQLSGVSYLLLQSRSQKLNSGHQSLLALACESSH